MLGLRVCVPCSHLRQRDGVRLADGTVPCIYSVLFIGYTQTSQFGPEARTALNATKDTDPSTMLAQKSPGLGRTPKMSSCRVYLSVCDD